MQEFIIISPSDLTELIKKAVGECLGDSATPSESAKVFLRPVDAKEACRYFSISRPTLKRWTDRGKIPVLRFGGVIRYDLDAVTTALESAKKGK